MAPPPMRLRELAAELGRELEGDGERWIDLDPLAVSREQMLPGCGRAEVPPRQQFIHDRDCRGQRTIGGGELASLDEWHAERVEVGRRHRHHVELDPVEHPRARLHRIRAQVAASQRRDGGWEDTLWNGTGFPRVFYLQYHLYAHYFPLWALGVWRRLVR